MNETTEKAIAALELDRFIGLSNDGDVSPRSKKYCTEWQDDKGDYTYAYGATAVESLAKAHDEILAYEKGRS